MFAQNVLGVFKMLDKGDYIGMNMNDLSFEQSEDAHNMDLNNCDKCGEIDHSEKLVWITSEDFEPHEDEELPEVAYILYDALCYECYKEELK